MPLNILINGAGVCGPALSTMLTRADLGHTITVVERSPALRTGGQQIDLRAQGIPVVRKLGLLETVRGRTVGEEGVAFVDGNGRLRAMFGVNSSGKGEQSLTSEFEIMRGDLVDVLYQDSLQADARIRGWGSGKAGSLRYEFGKYATDITQDEGGATVSVVFSDGSEGVYDLVIGADGQSSRTRRVVFGSDEDGGDVPFKSLGMYIALFSIPKSEDDKKKKMAYCYIVPESRLISARTGCPGMTQILFAAKGETSELEVAMGRPAAEQKELWARRFRGAGWEMERFLDGLAKTDDFYMQPIGQVKMARWSKGRVVLLGDAGYCPSPITGMGTTASLVGAYVLAGELARHGDDVQAALEAYETVLRPFVNTVQKLPPGAPGILYPKSWWGVSLLYSFLSVASKAKVEKLVAFLSPPSTVGWKIPEYPELNLDN